MVKISYNLKMRTFLYTCMNNQSTISTKTSTFSLTATYHLIIRSGLCAVVLAYILFSQFAYSAPPSIQLIAPAHEATIRNTQGQVHISWVAHAKANVVYEIYLDDVLKKNTPHTAMALTGVERGAHSIYLQVKDKNGKVIAASPTHTIYVHQNSKLFR